MEDGGGKNAEFWGISLEDDLREDSVCDVGAGFCVGDADVVSVADEVVHLRQRDVAAPRGVIKTAVGVLFDDEFLRSGVVILRLHVVIFRFFGVRHCGWLLMYRDVRTS